MCVKIAVLEQEKHKKQIQTILVILGIGMFSEEVLFSNTLFQKMLWVLFALLGIAVLIRQYKTGTVANSLVLISTPVPLVILMLYTVVRCLFVKDDLGIARQAFTTTMFVVVDIFMVIWLLYRYQQRCVDVLFWAIIASYALTVIGAICNAGFLGMFVPIPDADVSAYRTFERHDLGTAVVPLILYYLYRCLLYREKQPSDSLKKAGVLTLIMLISGKRGAYLGLAAGMAMLVMFLVHRKHIKTVCRWAMAGCVILPFLYVCFIRFGGLSFITELFHINSMGRVEVYEWFSDQYTISPFYLGKGFQYIHRYMVAGLGNSLVNDFGYLHNSILQLYIEGGFWGFFLWFSYMAVGIPLVLRKWYRSKAVMFYLIIIPATLAIFAVDNVLTYPLYQVCLYATLGAVMNITRPFCAPSGLCGCTGSIRCCPRTAPICIWCGLLAGSSPLPPYCLCSSTE